MGALCDLDQRCLGQWNVSAWCRLYLAPVQAQFTAALAAAAGRATESKLAAADGDAEVKEPAGDSHHAQTMAEERSKRAERMIHVESPDELEPLALMVSARPAWSQRLVSHPCVMLCCCSQMLSTVARCPNAVFALPAVVEAMAPATGVFRFACSLT